MGRSRLCYTSWRLLGKHRGYQMFNNIQHGTTQQSLDNQKGWDLCSTTRPNSPVPQCKQSIFRIHSKFSRNFST